MRVINRQTLIAKIHIAKAQLGMDEQSYRALLSRHGAESCTGLSLLQLDKVLHELAKKGFKSIGKKRGAPSRKTASKGKQPASQGDKIRALWINMAKEGLIKNGDESALRAYIKRMSHGRYEAPQFCDEVTASRIIESLKKWQYRATKEQSSC